MPTQEGFNYQATLKRVSPYNGKNPELFLDFKVNLRNALGGYKKTLLRLLDGLMKRPEPPGEGANNDQEMTVYNNTNEELYRVLFISTAGSTQTTVKLFEGVGEKGLGNGMTAWLALEERSKAATKEPRRTLSEKLTARTLKRHEDQQDFFYDMDLWRTRLEQMDELVSGYRYEDVIIQALPTEYDYVNNKSYCDRDFDVESIRRTTNNIFIYNLSRANPNGMESVVGRGAAMQAAGRCLSSDECYNCGELGHGCSNCPKPQRRKQQQLHKQNTSNGKKGGQGKHSSHHHCRSHDVSECLKQKEFQQQAGVINFANVGSARLSAQAAESGSSTSRFPLAAARAWPCLLYTSPSPRDRQKSRMPSSA